jgi:hypothetical protein
MHLEACGDQRRDRHVGAYDIGPLAGRKRQSEGNFHKGLFRLVGLGFGCLDRAS